MKSTTLLLFLSLSGALAQPPATSATGSISGMVRSTPDGQPIPDVAISTSRSGRQHQATTDQHGRYKLSGLDPGSYRVMIFTKPASGPGIGAFRMRQATLAAGQDLESFDFDVEAPGAISGIVVDENKEPLPGIHVMLVAREYSHGALAHVFAGIANTDDRGQYTLHNITPGRAFLLVAQKRPRTLAAISNIPANPKLRKPAIPATYYPGSPLLEGAQPLTLRAGEHRENVDLAVQRTPSYCLEGVLQAANGPAALRFSIIPQGPTSGRWGAGGVYIASPGGEAGPDGRIRICELSPGAYTLTAHSSAPGGLPQFYGSTVVSIVDQDVTKVVVPARPRVPVPVEVAWAGSAPDLPETADFFVRLTPLTRAGWSGENLAAKTSIPGRSSFDGLLADDYSVEVRGLPERAYVHDVTYAGRSIRHEPLRAGSEMGNATLRIAVGRDGGRIGATVADDDGKPVADAYVAIWPADVTSEAAVAAAMVSGQTDQAGAWQSDALKPGKYYVVALRAMDRSPECMNALWRARLSAKEVEVKGEAVASVALSPVALR